MCCAGWQTLLGTIKTRRMQNVRFKFCYHGFYQGRLSGMCKGGTGTMIFYEIILPDKTMIYLNRLQFQPIH